MGLKKGEKPWWNVGRKKLTKSALLQNYTTRLTAEQIEWLRRQENAAATLRALIDTARQD